MGQATIAEPVVSAICRNQADGVGGNEVGKPTIPDEWDGYDDVFADQVSFPGAAVVDPENYLDGQLVTKAEMTAALKGFKAGLITQHLITGHRVQLTDDTAVCRAHSINFHFPADHVANEALLATGNDYRFDCIRTDAGWRIRGFLATTRWSWGNTDSHDAAAKMRAWQDSPG